MHKPHSPNDDEIGFDADDDFALDVGEAWRAPDALARQGAEEADPFEDPFGDDEAHDPFAEAALPPYEGEEADLPPVTLASTLMLESEPAALLEEPPRAFAPEPAVVDPEAAEDLPQLEAEPDAVMLAPEIEAIEAELSEIRAFVAERAETFEAKAFEPETAESATPEPEAPEPEALEPEALEVEALEPKALETDTLETEAPETEAPETEVPETEAQEAEALESEEVEPEALEAAVIEAVSPEIPPVEAEAEEAEVFAVEAEAAAPAPAAEPPAPPAAEPFDPHAFGHAHHGELSVPRIGIHIFCEQPESLATAEQSAKDRRMARANTMVRTGGLAEAVQVYQNQPTPPLVIVECMDAGPALVAKLDQLAEVCDTGTKVVVIGQYNDITLYRELMRRGVSEYLVAPLHTLQLIQAITTLYADPSAPFVGRQIAFVGARGGVGSSTIAHNLAHALSEHMQSSTAIVDFDLPFGTAGLDFNQDPLQGVVDALSQPERLDPVLLERMMVRCSDRLSLFAAPATLDHDYEIAADAFEEVATKVRTAAPFVILDLPHLWSAWMRRVLLGADEVVLTATPDLASLRNAKNILDLMRQARPNDTPPRLVVNQVGLPGRPEIPIKDFSSALGVDNPVIVPFDAKLFGQAANNGQMVADVGPRSKPAESFHSLAQMIARREPPPAPKKSALASLFKLK